jgi:hypothetical protein
MRCARKLLVTGRFLSTTVACGVSVQGEGQRFSRQKWWLRQCGLSQVMYLIEGHPDRMQLSGK